MAAVLCGRIGQARHLRRVWVQRGPVGHVSFQGLETNVLTMSRRMKNAWMLGRECALRAGARKEREAA